MGRNLAAQFVPLWKHWLQLQLLVHLIDFLSILLRCNGFTGIQKALVDQMGSRPPNIDDDLFWVQVWLWEVLWSFFLIQPLSQSLPVVVYSPLFITYHNLIEKWLIVVQNKNKQSTVLKKKKRKQTHNCQRSIICIETGNSVVAQWLGLCVLTAQEPRVHRWLGNQDPTSQLTKTYTKENMTKCEKAGVLVDWGEVSLLSSNF